MNGRVLHFYLAGINNQNFLMRDKETGTWWQQITGKAIYGPLKGASLDLVLKRRIELSASGSRKFADGKGSRRGPEVRKGVRQQLGARSRQASRGDQLSGD